MTIESDFAKKFDQFLASLPDFQKACRHSSELMIAPDQCSCGLTLDPNQFRILRRLHLLMGWEEPALTDEQALCERKGHPKEKMFIGYARVGKKQFPHRISMCRCGVLRPTLQFKEIRRKIAKAKQEAEEKKAQVAHPPGRGRSYFF